MNFFELSLWALNHDLFKVEKVIKQVQALTKANLYRDQFPLKKFLFHLFYSLLFIFVLFVFFIDFELSL